MGKSAACMAVDSEFLQGSREGGDMMMTKHVHLHLRLEAANEGEAGLCVRQVWDAGVEVEEALDVDVDVAFLLEVSQGGAEMVGIIAVCVTARKDFHEVGVGGGIPLSGYSRSSVLEDGKCPGEAFLRGGLLGVVDKLQFPAPVSEVSASVEGRRVELESGARRLLGLLGLVEGSGGQWEAVAWSGPTAGARAREEGLGPRRCSGLRP